MGFVSVLFFPFLVSNNFRGKLDAHLLVFVHWVGWMVVLWVVICRRMSKFQYKYINLSNCIRCGVLLLPKTFLSGSEFASMFIYNSNCFCSSLFG